MPSEAAWPFRCCSLSLEVRSERAIIMLGKLGVVDTSSRSGEMGSSTYAVRLAISSRTAGTSSYGTFMTVSI
jgi:hypothetical protein